MPPAKPRRPDRVVFLLLAILAAVAAAAAVRARDYAGGTPPWDEASHGLQGYAIAQDVTRFDVPNFLADVVGARYRYPFGHSVLLVPAYLLFGPTWLTAVGVSALLYAALVLLLFLAGRDLATPPEASLTEPSAGGGPLLAGLVAAALGLTSPAVLAQATTIMLEMPAAVFGVVTAWLYGRSLDAPGSTGRLRAAGWALTAFVLTASQYATLWLVSVSLYEAWRSRPEDRRAARAWLAGVLRSRALWHPLHVVAALLIAFAAMILLTGGFQFTVGGRTVTITRPSNAVTLALFLVGARVAWLLWRHRDRVRAAVPARYQALFMTVVVPLFLWYFVLYPGRFAHYLNWISRPPAPISRAEGSYWTFYPAYAMEAGHLAGGVAATVLALAALAFLRRDAPEKIRFLRWAAVCTTAFVVLHHARQERFVVPLLPAWWLLAAGSVAWGWDRLRRPALRRGAGLAAAAALAAALGPPAAALYAERLPRLAAGTFTAASLGYRDVLLRVADEAAPSSSLRVIGTLPGLSHHLVEWELRRRVDVRGRTMEYDLDHPRKRFGDDPEGTRKVFERWLSKSPESLVIGLEPIDLLERPEKPLEGLWLHDLEWNYRSLRLLRGTDRYAVRGEWAFPAAGLRVRAYALREGRPPGAAK